MAITIEDAGDGIKTLLAGITVLKQIFAPNELSQSPNVFPCALILPGSVNYLEAFGTGTETTFRILILLSPMDSKVGMDTILPLMEKSGGSSVYATLNADVSLSGKAGGSVVRSCSGVGTTDWGGGTYLSTEFEIGVWI